MSKINRLSSPQIISRLKELGLATKDQASLLQEYNGNLASKFTEIGEFSAFLSYCENDFVVKGQTTDILNNVYIIFGQLISEESTIRLASLFNAFLKFLINLLNNPNVEKLLVKQMLIRIQRLWETEYYNKCTEMMHTVAHSVNVPHDAADTARKMFVESPTRCIRELFPFNKKTIEEQMIMHSEHPLILWCSKICINKFFPYTPHRDFEHHSLDVAFLDVIDRVTQEKGYKFLNAIDKEDAFNAFYDDLEREIDFSVSIYLDEKTLYDKIKETLDEFKLIEFNGEIFLAHLLQLFPILECKIREYGTYLSIVPFKERVDEFMHLKDPSSILQDILLQVYEETHSFENLPELFFVYLCMYNGNSLNIRNECVHGRKFLQGSELTKGFKLTLLCLNIILEKIAQLKIFFEKSNNKSGQALQ